MEGVLAVLWIQGVQDRDTYMTLLCIYTWYFIKHRGKRGEDRTYMSSNLCFATRIIIAMHLNRFRNQGLPSTKSKNRLRQASRIRMYNAISFNAVVSSQPITQ